MKDWAQGHVDGAGVSLRYFRSGGDKPPLVLVHGFTDNALYYTRLADVLAADWDVVAYDCRGHGASDRAGGRFSDADRVDDLVAVVRSLGLERPAMIGHSMGGATIALVVASHPGLSRGVVLEDPAWWEAPADESAEHRDARLAARRDGNKAWHDWLVIMQTSPREDAVAQRRADSPQWSDLDVNVSVDARLEVELALFEHFPQERSAWRPLVPRIDCPALLVIGENERGGIISAANAAEAASLNPRLQWAKVEGAGHAIRYDRFDSFLGVVVPFLAALS